MLIMTANVATRSLASDPGPKSAACEVMIRSIAEENLGIVTTILINSIPINKTPEINDIAVPILAILRIA